MQVVQGISGLAADGDKAETLFLIAAVVLLTGLAVGLLTRNGHPPR